MLLLAIVYTHNWRASLVKFFETQSFTQPVFPSSVIGHTFDCVCEVQLHLCLILVILFLRFDSYQNRLRSLVSFPCVSCFYRRAKSYYQYGTSFFIKILDVFVITSRIYFLLVTTAFWATEYINRVDKKWFWYKPLSWSVA